MIFSPRVTALFGLFVLMILFFLSAGITRAATTSTYLGKVYSGDGGSALNGYLDMPKGITVQTDGSFLVADTLNNAIRKIDRAGVLTTFSGNGEYGLRNGARTQAWWSEPEGISNVENGKVFIADTGSNTVRSIKGNTVRTIAIPGLKKPSAVLVRGGVLYIADTGNNRIVSAPVKGGKPAIIAKNISTPLKFARIGNILYVIEYGRSRVVAVDVVKKTAREFASGFIEPRAITAFKNQLYVAAGPSGIYNELWRLDPASGGKTQLFRERETEWLNLTADLAGATVNGEDRLFLLQSGGSSVFSLRTDGSGLTQLAGRHRFGDEQGSLSRAVIGRPKAIVATKDGSKMYVAYGQGNKIGVVNVATGAFSVLTGHLMDNYREGAGVYARFSDISALVLSPDEQTLYVADRNNERIRTVDIATGMSAYLTGAGYTNLISPKSASGAIDPDLDNGYQEGAACPDIFELKVSGCAYFNRPMGVALTKDGKTLYIADTSNQRIRSLNRTTGQTKLLAGSGEKKLKDGIASKASFNGPTSIVLSRDESMLYVADKNNHAIRAIRLATGKVTTLAGGRAGFREGGFSRALFSVPETILLGAKDVLYVAEAGGQRIRKLDLQKRVVTTISGNGQRGKKNGQATVAEWNVPKGMTLIGQRLYVSDYQNDLIRSIRLSP